MEWCIVIIWYITGTELVYIGVIISNECQIVEGRSREWDN